MTHAVSDALSGPLQQRQEYLVQLEKDLKKRSADQMEADLAIREEGGNC
jgi:hypothetical protein